MIFCSTYDLFSLNLVIWSWFKYLCLYFTSFSYWIY